MFRKIATLLTLFFFISTSLVSANTDSAVNNLYPTEEEMGMNTDIELLYQEIPPENFQWDTNLKFVEWDGILPEFKNPTDVTDNTVFSSIFKTSVQFVRFSVFLLNLGFSTNVLTQSIDEIQGDIESIADKFFKEVFPITSTILVIFMIIAWVRGQKGHMFKLLLVALLASTLLMGVAKNISSLAEIASGLIDDISLKAVGILNLDGGSASEIGAERIARTNNMIWQVTVDEPWTIGQFGSRIPPNITSEEGAELRKKEITINQDDNWKDLFLRYGPGFKERVTLVDILSDEDIPHENELATKMMEEYSLSTRIKVSVLTLVLSAFVLALFTVVAGAMIVSGILLLAGMIVIPFIIPLPYLGDTGMRWVKNYLSFMMGSALLKISSTLYMTVVMIILYIINLFDWPFMIKAGIMIMVLGVATVLTPWIWRRMSPGIAKVIGPVENFTKKSVSQVKKLNPQEPIEKMFEKMGQIREQRSIEAELERKRRAPLRETEQELQALEQAKQQAGGAQYAASGLAQKEEQLRNKYRMQQLSMVPLTDLQSERQQYERKIAAGESLSEQEQRELMMIQQAERNRLRYMLRPSDRQAFDQLAYNQNSNFSELQSLRQQKLNNPMEFVAAGGEAKMRYLEEKQRQNELQERELLSANIKTSENHSNEELRQFLKQQGGESILAKHLENTAPLVDEGRQLLIESMSQEELQAEQQIYEEKLLNNEQLDVEQQNDYFALQHQDWSNTISQIDDSEIQEKLKDLHVKETGFELQLRDLNNAQENDHEKFVEMGGEVKQEEIRKNLFNVREQTQENLRNSGHREEAEKHLKMAENRDMMLLGIEKNLNELSKSNKEKEQKQALTYADIIKQAREQRAKQKISQQGLMRPGQNIEI